MSATKAGMSRNTARKYLRQKDVTEQRRVPHTWRTRQDPLALIWPQAEAMLRQAPELEAKALFEHLAASHPETIQPGLLRTFQRRVKAWRHQEGPDKEVFSGHNVGAQAFPCRVAVFELAADVGSTAVETALEHLLGTARASVNAAEVKALIDDCPPLKQEWRQRGPLPVNLAE